MRPNRAQSTYEYCSEGDLPRESHNAIRFAPHVFNAEVDIDRIVRALGTMVSGGM